MLVASGRGSTSPKSAFITKGAAAPMPSAMAMPINPTRMISVRNRPVTLRLEMPMHLSVAMEEVCRVMKADTALAMPAPPITSAAMPTSDMK